MKNNTKQIKSPLGTQPIGTLIARFAVPGILCQIILVLYGFVDSAFVGHIPVFGESALAGMGVALPVTIVVQTIASWIGAGTAPLAGILLGAGNADDIKKLIGTSYFMIGVSCAIVFVIFFPAAPLLLDVFGASETTLPYATTYLNIYFIAMPFIFINLGFSGVLMMEGKVKQVLWASVASTVINISLDALFVLVLGWGVAGAAIATVVAAATNALVVLYYLQRPASAFRIRRSDISLSGPIARRVLLIDRRSFTIGITEGLLALVLNNQIEAYGGDSYITALTIIRNFELICLSVSIGFTKGVHGIIAYSYGARKLDRLKTICVRTILISWALAAVLAALFIAFCGPLANTLTDSPQIMQLVAQYAPLYLSGTCAFGIFIAILTIFAGTANGAKSVMISVIHKIVFSIPLLFILPKSFGAYGIFGAIPAADILAVVAALIVLACTIPRIKRFGQPKEPQSKES